MLSIHSKSRLVPALQTFDWGGTAVCVHQPLLEVESSWMPILTFADDRPTTRDLRTEGDAEDLRQASIQNLPKLPYRLEVLRGATEGLPFDVAVLEGGYASEQVLCPETMRRVATQLGCRRLVVGIPQRGVLFAVSAEDGDDVVGLFLRFASMKFFEAPYQPLTPMGFLVADGHLVGAASGMEESGRSVAQVAPEAQIDLRVEGETVFVTARGDARSRVQDKARNVLQRRMMALGMQGVTVVDVDVEFLDLGGDLDVIAYTAHLRQAHAELAAGVPVPELREITVRGPGVNAEPCPLSDAGLRALGLAPFAAFALVGMADGKLDGNALETFQAGLMGVRDPLIRSAVTVNQMGIEEALAELLQDGGKMLDVLTHATAEVRERLPEARAKELVAELFEIGVRTARAGLEPGAEAMGEAERTALRLLAAVLGLA